MKLLFILSTESWEDAAQELEDRKTFIHIYDYTYSWLKS